MEARSIWLVALACVACSAVAPEQPKGWTVRADLQAKLPKSIVVYERVSNDPPLRAWMVEARPDATQGRPAHDVQTSNGLEGAGCCERGLLLVEGFGQHGGG